MITLPKLDRYLFGRRRAPIGSTPNKYKPHQGAKECASRVRQGLAGTHYAGPPWDWKRAPQHDRRIGRGDDFAGDAWVKTATGAIHYTAVGRRISTSLLRPVELGS